MQSPSVPSFYSNGVPTPTNTSFPAPNESVNNGLMTAFPSPQKRNQVKNACTNCQKACKKCADERPCPRCTKYGIADTCVSSVRKERKKGIKRGPYKRRQKSTDDKIEGTSDLPNITHDGTATIITDNKTSTTSVATSSGVTAAGATTAANNFGYPAQLGQYGQYYYNPGSDDKNGHILPAQYVIPVYPNYHPPVLVDGDTTATTPTPQETTDSKDETNKENTPEDKNDNNTSYLAHQAISIILNSATNNSGAGIYYPNNNAAQEKENATQPLTPIPSTSNTSSTASPFETNEDEDEKFTRLTELCTAALRENLESKAKEATNENDTVKNE